MNPDQVIADFEGDTYGEWKVTGDAFGPGPARGTLPNQMLSKASRGRGLSIRSSKGDASIGTLTSPEFTVERKFVELPDRWRQARERNLHQSAGRWKSGSHDIGPER